MSVCVYVCVCIVKKNIYAVTECSVTATRLCNRYNTNVLFRFFFASQYFAVLVSTCGKKWMRRGEVLDACRERDGGASPPTHTTKKRTSERVNGRAIAKMYVCPKWLDGMGGEICVLLADLGGSQSRGDCSAIGQNSTHRGIKAWPVTS